MRRSFRLLVLPALLLACGREPSAGTRRALSSPPEAPAEVKPPAREEAPAGKKRILIVDDERSMCELIQTAMRIPMKEVTTMKRERRLSTFPISP
mgnify:CR=1 FL=1